MAIVRVQGNHNESTTGLGTIAVTISAVTSGNTICGLVSWDPTGGITLSSVADDKGNTYNLETTRTDTTNNVGLAAFSLTNITNAPVTITATFSTTANFRFILVDEFSGTSTSSTDERDGTAHGGQFQNSPGTATDGITSGTFTTATNGDLIWGGCMAGAVTTLATHGTNFSDGTTNSTTNSFQSEYREQATAGSGTAATFTQASNTQRTTFLLAIKPGISGTAHVGQATFSGLGAFPTLSGFGLSPLQPDADSIDGTWTDQAGGTSLFAAIDEMSVDDADYIKSAASPVNDICKISLGNPTTTPAEPFIVMYRYEKTGVEQMDLGARLLQGTTEIAAWSHSDISTSFVTAEQTLSGGQFSAISDFNNLFIEFTATGASMLTLEGDLSGDLTLEGDFSGSLLLEGS